MDRLGDSISETGVTVTSQQRVAVVCGVGVKYNNTAPFDPQVAYPEYRLSRHVAAVPNPAYAGVREILRTLGMDAAAFGTAAWNPFRELIRPGNVVLLKPNFVISRHRGGGDLFSAITHPSVLRALIDYAYIALEGAGRIVIADAPQMDCDFAELLEATQLREIARLYKESFNFDIEIVDLRQFCMVDPNAPAYAGNRRPLNGDPAGSTWIDLAGQSHFADITDPSRYYGADYDRSETIRLHSGPAHSYEISKTVLSADVVISVPKLKVHKKVGVTLNMKGLVGTITNKNCLVHYRLGSPSEGGDQIPDRVQGADRSLVRLQRFIYDALLSRQNRAGDFMHRIVSGVYRGVIKPFVRISPETTVQDSGNWHGNDSAWRMAADLLKIFTFADANGRLHQKPQRRMFALVDGIVGGENDGPLRPDARLAGCLVGGTNLLAVDLTAARLMGFDIRLIRQFNILKDPKGFNFGLTTPSDVNILSSDVEISNMFRHQKPLLSFKPHAGWTGTIEFAPNVVAQKVYDSSKLT